MKSFFLLQLKELSLDASIGIHDFERAARQRILASVTLLVSDRPTRADDIATTIDYDFLHENLTFLAANRHWDLQESLCEALLDKIFGQETQGGHVLCAIVKTQKPDVYAHARAIGCTMARFNPNLAAADGLPSDFPWWTINV